MYRKNTWHSFKYLGFIQTRSNPKFLSAHPVLTWSFQNNSTSRVWCVLQADLEYILADLYCRELSWSLMVYFNELTKHTHALKHHISFKMNKRQYKLNLIPVVASTVDLAWGTIFSAFMQFAECTRTEMSVLFAFAFWVITIILVSFWLYPGILVMKANIRCIQYKTTSLQCCHHTSLLSIWPCQHTVQYVLCFRFYYCYSYCLQELRDLIDLYSTLTHIMRISVLSSGILLQWFLAFIHSS